MFLNATTDLLRINVATASDIEVHVAYGSADDGAPPTVSDFDSVVFASITGTGNTTILTGVANDILKVIGVSAFNNHASQSTVVYFDYFDTTNAVKLAGSQCTLLAGESLLMLANGRWVHYDSNGAEYPSVGNVASQAEQEAGTATDKYTSPGRQQFHPSAVKFWVDTTPGNANNASYNVTSVSDTAAGITVITIATDFSSANWCPQATCESTSDTMTVTNLKFVRIGLGDVAAGTVSVEVHDGTATTAVLEDPTSWFVCGFGDQ